MAKQRLKTVQAGNLVRAVLWTGAFPSDAPKARAEKSKFSTMARQAINDRTSWEKLRMILEANFSQSDLMLTLTYDDAHLPPTRAVARKCMKKFIGLLRSYRKARGQAFFYVYNIECRHEAGRYHHHMVVNGTGEDYDVIRSLWEFGTNLEFTPIDQFGMVELSKYLTKEARECRASVGDRSWVGSRNLKKPVASPAQWVNVDVALEPPLNADVIKNEYLKNEWGRYHYLEYRLPSPPKHNRTRPRKSKTANAVTDLEHCILNGERQ